MIKYATPESVGISTQSLKKYLEHLEANSLATHDVIIARGNNIVLEKYWAPFDREFRHRLYSVTKSFVALAIGFLYQDGTIDLDDPIAKYFPDEMSSQTDENMREQTIRHMLIMSTAKIPGYWFSDRPTDRVKYYFENSSKVSRPAGTIFNYDSTGTFILGALVERLTGKTLVEFLDERMFSKIGIEGVDCLKCPGGHSWSDSAFLMRPIDLLRSARFVMNGGEWDGEQILDRNFIKAATSKQIDNTEFGETEFDKLGYGYKFWMTKRNGYFFNGMGCQLAFCLPEKDVILVYNGDNQGFSRAKSIIFDGFLDIVYDSISDTPLPEYNGEPIGDYELFAVGGMSECALKKEISGVKYTLDDNPMKINELTVTFDEDSGELKYVNATGEKTLGFGLCKNVFGLFPEEGYSDKIGTVSVPGHKYKCAASAAFVGERELFIRVQIIDKYFGNLGIKLGFREDGRLGVYMVKNAEDFLQQYSGYATGRRVK